MRNLVLSLCDLTGNAVAPWVDDGYEAFLVDPQHVTTRTEGPVTKFAGTIEDAMPLIGDLIRNGRVAFVMGWPPCTDMAVSGARWFEAKRAKDPLFQAKAVMVAEQCRTIGRLSGAPWMAVRQTQPHVPPTRLHRLGTRRQLHQKDLPLDRGGASPCPSPPETDPSASPTTASTTPAQDPSAPISDPPPPWDSPGPSTTQTPNSPKPHRSHAMTVDDVKARARAIAEAIHAIPETPANYRELRRAKTEATRLLEAAALGEPETVDVVGADL